MRNGTGGPSFDYVLPFCFEAVFQHQSKCKANSKILKNRIVGGLQEANKFTVVFSGAYRIYLFSTNLDKKSLLSSSIAIRSIFDKWLTRFLRREATEPREQIEESGVSAALWSYQNPRPLRVRRHRDEL